jgi:RecB family exonuclease
VQHDDTAPPSIELLELDWRQRHLAAMNQPKLSDLLEARLNHYQLSPTHLNTFLDLEYGGPERFFFSTILRFPEAPTLDGEFGSAVHETFEWLQHEVTARKTMPPSSEILAYFTSRIRTKSLTPSRIELEIERGEKALAAYLVSRGHTFKPGDKVESSFKNEGIFVKDAHLAGKIDKLEIDAKNKTIAVVDYKTGKSYSRWENVPKLYHYRRQLYCYKLLVENSKTFAGYHVTHGRLEFVEPDRSNRINLLELDFKDEEQERTKQLLAAMWRHVKQLNFPSTRAYGATLTGIRQFEHDLIDGKI